MLLKGVNGGGGVLGGERVNESKNRKRTEIRKILWYVGGLSICCLLALGFLVCRALLLFGLVVVVCIYVCLGHSEVCFKS